jgi:class 3 adenylate cyclase
MTALGEPVRGSLPDPSLLSLSGLEQLRAYMRGLVLDAPLYRLLGPRVTQVSSGTAVLHQQISPWFEVYDGFIDLTPTAEYVVDVTARTGAPPGVCLRVVDLSLRYLRPCTVDDEIVIARGRILHAGSNFTTVEALMEDALGRAVAHAMGSVVLRPLDPPPPTMTRALEPVEEPAFSTPDPVRRPLHHDPSAGGDKDGKPSMPPFGQFLGAEYLEVSESGVTVAMPTSEWFCRLHREVSPGIIGLLANLAVRQSILEVCEPEDRFVILNATTSSIVPVRPDGHRLVAHGAVVLRRDEVIAIEASVTDHEGQTVVLGRGICLIRPRAMPARQRVGERRLLTVLFTDLVGSTAHAQKIGDARWRELLDEHNAIIRRQLGLHKGREVKTTGDGVLATFDSPTRAVECARGIRQGLRQLGLDIRAGIHTGECELVGHDVAGVAVHVASRVLSEAQSGEILVSSTVRDLIGGSEVLLLGRGAHQLKGLEGTWVLLAVAD